MFTFVISLVVVGAALFFATRIAVGPAPKPDKPATPVARSVVGHHAAEAPAAPAVGPVPAHVARLPAEAVDRVTIWRRLRAAILLVMVLTVLGAIAALLLVIFGAIALSGLRSAVQ